MKTTSLLNRKRRDRNRQQRLNQRSRSRLLRFESMEARMLLAADFGLSAGTLTLDNFTQVDSESLAVSEAGSSYRFALSEGTWTTRGSPPSGFSLASGDQVLEIEKSLLSGGTISEILVSDTTGINFNVTFGDVNLQPLSGSLALLDVGDVVQTAGSIVQFGHFDVTAASVTLAESGNDFVSVRATATAGGVTLFDAGDIVLGTPGLADTAGVSGGDYVVTAEGTIIVSAGHGIDSTGTSAVSLTAGRNIALATGSSITTVDGGITLQANQQATPTSGGFIGIEVNDAVMRSDSGAILLQGRGGDAGGQQYGVHIHSGGAVGLGATGPVTVEGTGGASSDSNNHGVWVSGIGSQITSGGGDVLVEGTGGGKETSGFNYGVVASGNGVITSAGQVANVTVNGYGGNKSGTGGNVNYGVQVSTNAAIMSSGGAVLVEGTGGGAGSSGSNHGLVVRSGGKITNAGTANTAAVEVKGYGGNASQAEASHGVFITGNTSLITSSGGAVLVEGTGAGTGAFRDNHGVLITSAGSIASSGTDSTSTVTVRGFGGFLGKHGVNISGTNSIITSSGGAVLVEGIGGGSGGAVGVHIGIQASITSDGDESTVTVYGQGGDGDGTTNNHGVRVDGTNAIITSSGGAVLVKGIGGGTGNSNSNRGVYVVSGGTITNAGTHIMATVTVYGHGGNDSGDGLGGNHGVGVNSSNSLITSSGGAVLVDGTGGGAGTSSNNYGVNVSSSGVITSGGTDASVTVTGSGGGGDGERNYGVYVAAGRLSSGGAGIVSVTGVGGAGAGGDNHGVYVQTGEITSGGGDVLISGQGSENTESTLRSYGVEVGGSLISAGGLGNVTITGVGGAGLSQRNYGVYVRSVAVITSNGGDVSVWGQGGDGDSSLNYGVMTTGDAEITSGGSGNVAVTGIGGKGAGSNNVGVYVQPATISSGGAGTVTVLGQGGGNADSGGGNRGILMSSAVITSGGIGQVTVSGFGGAGPVGSNDGIYFLAVTVNGVDSGDTVRITSGGGDVHVLGHAGDGPANQKRGIDLGAGSGGGIIASGNNADITITTDGLWVGATTEVAIDSGTGKTTLRPYSSGTLINLGGPSSAATNPPTLGFTAAVMEKFTAGTLVIGDTDSGTLTVTADIARTAATNMQLISGDDIVISGGSIDNGGGTLSLHAGDSPAAIKPTRSGTDVTASTLALANDLAIMINGTAVDIDYTQLSVVGTVDLTGVDLVLSGSYVPVNADVFTIVSATSVTGQFNGLAEGDEVMFGGEPLTVNYTATSVTLTANLNSPPVADAGGPYAVDEGMPLTLDASASSDPDEPTAGLTFQWDLDYDGTTFDVDAVGIAPSVSFPDDFAARVIALRVTDAEGESDIATTTLTVNNVAPTASVTGPSSGVRNQPLTFVLEGTDPSPIDQAAGFTYAIDWDGDGTVDQIVAGSDMHELEYAFEAMGTYVVTVTATDKDGGTSATATHTVEIAAAVVDNDGNLIAGGQRVNARPGSIVLEFLDNDGNIVEQLSFDDAEVTGSLIIYGSPGNDEIRVDSGLTLPVILYGGAGDDILQGGGGDNLLVGGDGNDVLIGGAGTNTIIGGSGSNTFVDGGGTNTFEADDSGATADADPPQIIVAPVAAGNEKTPIPLAIWAGLSDTDGSETLSVQITGVPEFAVLSSGTKNADGSWTLTTAETSINLIGMTVTAPESGVFTLTVAATATETANGTVSTTSASIEVTVRNVVDLAGRVFDDLAGRVFDDLNNDGVFDVGESGLENVVMELVDESDSTVVAATTTAADGTYEFSFGTLGLGVGTYTIRQQSQPSGYLDGKESVGDLGGDAADNGNVINHADSNAITGIVIRESGTQQDSAGYDFAEIRPSSLQGLVWEDFDNNGDVDFGETAIEGVEITLSGTDDRGNAVNLTQSTDVQGIFEFVDLRPGTYSISQSQPDGFVDGKDVVGEVNGILTGDNDGGTPALSTTNDQFTSVVLATPGSIGINYNFGERVDGGSLGSGQTASIGFWQNRNGQRLIKSLNGSADSTLLAQYLSGTFSNMYGMLADANGDGTTGDYMTNIEVAYFYKDLFKRNGRTAPGGPPKLDAQVLAVAMSTYITRQSLVEFDYGNNMVNNTLVADVQSFGFVVTVGGVGSTFVNVGDSGAAFGVADDSEVQIIDLLLAANDWSTDGLLYDLNDDGEIDDTEEFYRIMANDIFSRINEM